MVGSAAWSVAMLAAGNIDAVYFPNIYKWDIMGGAHFWTMIISMFKLQSMPMIKIYALLCSGEMDN